MVAAAYVAFAVLVFILAAAAGTVIAAWKGQASGHFAHPGFITVTWLIFGIPCYFVGTYLRNHGNEGFSLLIVLIAGVLGVVLGIHNRA